tara:strand:- start:472 stop:618 length:147 start_codon:yes stop_codon:yes gene_type:complete
VIEWCELVGIAILMVESSAQGEVMFVAQMCEKEMQGDKYHPVIKEVAY